MRWLSAQGVWFCNTRTAIAEATADMALFLVVAVVRDVGGMERGFREGRWRGREGVRLMRDPGELVLGVVGMGAIGRRVARKVRAAFGMRVAYWTRGGGRVGREVEEEVGGELVHCETLEELCGMADVVSLHCPLSEETRGLLGREQLKAMKPGSFVVNTARGGVVDEEALIEALESGHIARAGLDVFEGEGTDGKRIREYFLTSEKVVVQPYVEVSPFFLESKQR